MNRASADKLAAFFKDKQSKSIIDSVVGNGNQRIVEHWTRRRIQVAQLTKTGK